MPTAQLPRPFVTANFALTWDAKVSTKNRSPANFSSPRDKRRLLEIRSEADAILVGATTIATDHMSMGLPAADLRARIVDLTVSGRRLIEKAFQRHSMDMEEALAVLKNDERVELVRLMKKAGLSAASHLADNDAKSAKPSVRETTPDNRKRRRGR